MTDSKQIATVATLPRDDEKSVTARSPLRRRSKLPLSFRFLIAVVGMTGRGEAFQRKRLLLLIYLLRMLRPYSSNVHQPLTIIRVAKFIDCR